MAMLKNDNGPGTVVGANVKLTGTLKDSADIVVHGNVEGEVISDKNVTVEPNATVKGPVTAQIVTVSGTIRGAVTAHDKLEMLQSGNINGAISTANLIIHSGAQFNGKCSMAEKSAGKQDSSGKKEQEKSDSSGDDSDEFIKELEAEIE